VHLTWTWQRANALTLAVVVGAAALGITGCSAPSLLITPVSGKRALIETELSRDSLFAVDKVALIDISGLLVNMPRFQFLAEGEHPVSLLLEQLDKARRDRSVKAVILRINSPGGTVVASELMHDEITRFKEGGKPVVAIMMDVAASGAYYIACACDEIVAQPSTVTGSIGVVMQMFDLSGTMQMVGVKSDAITSGAFKDAGSPLRPMRPEEREVFEQIVKDMYERFIKVVAAGRPGLEEADVRRLADGRVYTATQALEAGLIDRIMTMRGAIEIVKQRADLKRIRLVAYQRASGYRPNYYAQAPSARDGDVNLLKVDLPSLFDVTVPQFMYLWAPGLR
jgi:protease-4